MTHYDNSKQEFFLWALAYTAKVTLNKRNLS